MKRALFLDRDGTLIHDSGYLGDPAGVVLLPGVAAALRRARDLGYALFLFTNQSGIGRGYFTLADALACNRRMLDLLDLGPDLFTATCITPDSSDQPSLYRKPSPRFILESIAQYDLDAANSHMIGDRLSDIEAGLAAGITAAALCTGELTAEQWRTCLPPGATLHADLPAFVATLP